MNKQIKLITYNIDGLPEKLDLNDLPWILKPVAWIYKLFKGTTVITINDNENKSNKTKQISERLKETNADIIAVQEDFNYHDELMSVLNSDYLCGKYTGGFDLSKIFSNTEWLSYFPLPRFKCDGINIFTKNSIVKQTIESITAWKKSYGYFTHANDLLTHKGFRFYQLNINNNINLDVYIIHMDADFYNIETCPDVSGDIEARKQQLIQLTNYILEKYNSGKMNPIIIMGDTNSSNSYPWDVNNITNYLINPINNTKSLEIHEIIPNNKEDVDRIFYVNSKEANYSLIPKKCYYDESFKGLSDHFPLIVEFGIENKN